jgi:hypothetical protein
MVVSKKGLRGSALIGFGAAEAEPGGKRAAETAQMVESALPAAVAADLELTVAGDTHLDLIALFQAKSFDDSRGKPQSETVSPL